MGEPRREQRPKSPFLNATLGLRIRRRGDWLDAEADRVVRERNNHDRHETDTARRNDGWKGDT